MVLVTRDNTHQNAMISVYLTEKYRLTKRQIKRYGMGLRIVLVCERVSVCVCVCECECVLMWQWLWWWYMCIPFGVRLANVCLIKIYEIQQVSRIKWQTRCHLCTQNVCASIPAFHNYARLYTTECCIFLMFWMAK